MLPQVLNTFSSPIYGIDLPIQVVEGGFQCCMVLSLLGNFLKIKDEEKILFLLIIQYNKYSICHIESRIHVDVYDVKNSNPTQSNILGEKSIVVLKKFCSTYVLCGV